MRALHLPLAFALTTCALLTFACQPASHTDAQVAAAGRSGPCVSCHMPEFDAVRHPPHRDKKPMTCEVCHRSDSWSPSVLQHPWALTGAHEKADCFKCHEGKPPKYKGTPKKCIACHQSDVDRINEKSSKHRKFAETCEDCHSTTDWKHRHKKREE